MSKRTGKLNNFAMMDDQTNNEFENNEDDVKDETTNEIQMCQYKAVGNPEKFTLFHCNLAEIYFELIG